MAKGRYERLQTGVVVSTHPELRVRTKAGETLKVIPVGAYAQNYEIGENVPVALQDGEWKVLDIVEYTSVKESQNI
jgi:hypothetical protein